MVMLSLISKFNYYYSILKLHKCTILYNHTNVTILKRGMKKGGEGIVKAATKIVSENSNVLSSQSQNIPNVNTPQSSPQSSPNTSTQNSPGSSPQSTPPSSPSISLSNKPTGLNPRNTTTFTSEKYNMTHRKPGYYGFFQYSQMSVNTQNKDNPNRFITNKETFNLPRSKIQNNTEWTRNSNGTWFKRVNTNIDITTQSVNVKNISESNNNNTNVTNQNTNPANSPNNNDNFNSTEQIITTTQASTNLNITQQTSIPTPSASIYPHTQSIYFSNISTSQFNNNNNMINQTTIITDSNINNNSTSTQQTLYVDSAGVSHTTPQVLNIPTPSTNSISNDNNINTQQTNIPIAPPLPNKSIHVKPSIAPSKELENIIKSSNNNSLKPSDVKAAVSQNKDSTIVDRHHILTSDSTHVLQGKQALRYFCSYFQNVSLNQLEKDPVFIHYFKELTEKNPSMYTRAFQLTLETVYSKRYFQEKDIQEIFKGNLSIKDVIGTNNGKVDSSTFFSVLQTNHLLNQPDFRDNTDLRVVISTSIKSDNLKDITNPYVRQFIQNSKTATGNSLNDIIIDGHHYDFKMSVNISNYRQNHIIFFDYHEININKKAQIYLKTLHDNFENIVKEHTLNSLQHSDNIQYINHAKSKLKNIMDNPNTNALQKILEWNSYVFNFNKRPHTVYFPILVPTDTKPFSPDPNLVEDIKKIDLPISKTLETKAVLNAVKRIMDKNDPLTKHKAYLHSKGVIGEELKNQSNKENINENKDEEKS